MKNKNNTTLLKLTIEKTDQFFGFNEEIFEYPHKLKIAIEFLQSVQVESIKREKLNKELLAEIGDNEFGEQYVYVSDSHPAEKLTQTNIYQLLWDEYGTNTITSAETGKLIRQKQNMQITNNKKNTDTGNYYLKKFLKLRLAEIWKKGRPTLWKMKP